MALEHLKEAGILLPEEEWGTRALSSRVPKVPLLLVGALAPVSAVLMFLGDGRPLTWIGLGIFLVALAAFTALSLKGIR